MDGLAEGKVEDPLSVAQPARMVSKRKGTNLFITPSIDQPLLRLPALNHRM